MRRAVVMLAGLVWALVAWAADPPGTVVLAAKDAKLSGDGMMRYQPETNRQCIGHWNSTTGTIAWTFHAPAKQTYRVVVVAACVTPEAGSEFEVAVGTQIARGKGPDTGEWGNFVDVDLGPVMVRKPGEVAVTIRGTKIAKRAVMNLRAVKLVPEI